MRPHPISVSDDYWGVRRGSRSGIEPRPSVPICRTHGLALVDAPDGSYRSCPVCGRQRSYIVRLADGRTLEADYVPTDEIPGRAMTMLKMGYSVVKVAEVTGRRVDMVTRWREMIRAEAAK